MDKKPIRKKPGSPATVTRVKPKSPGLIANYIAGGAFVMASKFKPVGDFFNQFNEPFNLANHMPNLGISMVVGSFVTSMTCNQIGKHNYLRGQETPLVRTRVAGILGSVVTVIALNGFAESPYGQMFYGRPLTGDPIDFAYGVAGATIGAFAPKIEQVPNIWSRK